MEKLELQLYKSLDTDAYAVEQTILLLQNTNPEYRLGAFNQCLNMNIYVDKSANHFPVINVYNKSPQIREVFNIIFKPGNPQLYTEGNTPKLEVTGHNMCFKLLNPNTLLSQLLSNTPYFCHVREILWQSTICEVALRPSLRQQLLLLNAKAKNYEFKYTPKHELSSKKTLVAGIDDVTLAAEINFGRGSIEAQVKGPLIRIHSPSIRELEGFQSILGGKIVGSLARRDLNWYLQGAECYYYLKLMYNLMPLRRDEIINTLKYYE